MKDVSLLLEKALTQTLEGVGDVPPSLKEALFYAVFPGGKRIRPYLSFLLCEDLAGPAEDLLFAAQSLELVHCASLVHDDLPALDNDDYRRGKPSVHKAFGEAHAILLADYMIPLAFGCIVNSPFTPEKKIRFTRSLAEAFADVCHGQARDMEGNKSLAELERTHRLKTGALFRAAAEFSAIAASDRQETFRAASALGAGIGFCFQIADDYLDAFGTDPERGRPAGSDARNQKQTFFSIMTKDGGLQYLRDAADKVDLQFAELEKAVSPESTLHQTRALFRSVLARATVV